MKTVRLLCCASVARVRSITEMSARACRQNIIKCACAEALPTALMAVHHLHECAKSTVRLVRNAWVERANVQSKKCTLSTSTTAAHNCALSLLVRLIHCAPCAGVRLIHHAPCGRVPSITMLQKEQQEPVCIRTLTHRQQHHLRIVRHMHECVQSAVRRAHECDERTAVEWAQRESANGPFHLFHHSLKISYASAILVSWKKHLFQLFEVKM